MRACLRMRRMFRCASKAAVRRTRAVRSTRTLSTSSGKTDRSFWELSPKIEYVLRRAGVDDPDTRTMLSSAGATAIWASGGLALLGTVGVDTTPLVASAGITGATFGFAAKDIIGNFMSGVLTVANDRVKRGAEITAAGHRGKVVKIDMSRLMLRTDQGDTVLIPSSKLLGSTIVIHKESEE